MQRIKSRLKVDNVLLISILLLLFIGLITFLSTAFGILPSNESKFLYLIKTQILYVFVFGLLALYLGYKIEYFYYKKISILIFILTFLFSFSTLIPQIAFNYNGATRWINLFGFSLQPSEILKFGVILLFSFLCLKYKKYFENYKFGTLFMLFLWAILSIPILLFQKDFGTMSIIFFSSFMIYFVAGAKLKYILTILFVGLLAFLVLLEFRPHMKERVNTFLNPNTDILGSSYQINQSLIAIGAGDIFGRGIGQSIQKFGELPEQISDSIFAVYAEEFGFIGSVFLIILYFFIIWRSVFILKRIEDPFAVYLGVGIISIFFFQTFLNIASSTGIMPFTGVPLPLVSRGGTSLIFLLFQLGILLNISKYRTI